MDVDRIRNAAARWLVDHPNQTGVDAADAKLLRHVAKATGYSETRVFDVLVDHWPAIESIATQASSTSRRQASGGAGAQLLASGHESPPIAGVTVQPIRDTSWISDDVLMRTDARDRKGRLYGTPSNPGVPPIDRFRPRLWLVRAGELASLIKDRKHGRFEEQKEQIAQLSDAALLRVRPEDPISALQVDGGLSLTGGHHRTWEIIDRVRQGKMSSDEIVGILVHD